MQKEIITMLRIKSSSFMMMPQQLIRPDNVSSNEINN